MIAKLIPPLRLALSRCSTGRWAEFESNALGLEPPIPGLGPLADVRLRGGGGAAIGMSDIAFIGYHDWLGLSSGKRENGFAPPVQNARLRTRCWP